MHIQTSHNHVPRRFSDVGADFTTNLFTTPSLLENWKAEESPG